MEQDPVLEERLKALGAEPIDGGLASTHLMQMAGAVRSSRRRAKMRVAGAVVAACLVATSGLAAADALPDPAQHLAHRALHTVGVGVPDPERYHGPECGSEVKKNHGAYVRDDHDLAASQCGKKIHAGQGEDSEDGDKASKAEGPCQGPPPWAGKDKTSMSPEAKAKAQADRAAACGEDDAEEGAGDDPAATERQATTTTTAPSTTTTTVESSTTTTTETATTETTATTGG